MTANVAANTRLVVTDTDVLNPSAGSYAITIGTSSDRPAINSAAYAIASPTTS